MFLRTTQLVEDKAPAEPHQARSQEDVPERVLMPLRFKKVLPLPELDAET